MTCFSSFFAIIWQKMKKNMSWKFTDESFVTFQSSVSGAGEFGHKLKPNCVKYSPRERDNTISIDDS